jgi:nicotinate-nucleotide adenylyltransferase
VDIGLFGGSFDPPHAGHLIVAQDAMERLGLDRVRFVPARISPFKVDGDERGPAAPAELRLEMVRAALADHPAMEVDRAELDRDGPSYTVDTLRAFRAREPDIRWTLLIGSDQWASFGRWREPEVVASLASIAVMTRSGVDLNDAGGPDLPHRSVPVTRVDISSTELRRRVCDGRSIRFFVPEAVRALIEANGLYSTC